MSAVDAQDSHSKFVNKFEAYRELIKSVGKVSREENYSTDRLKIDEKIKEELPEEYSEFIDFVNQNLIALVEEDDEALNKLRERSITLLWRIKYDIDKEIWEMIDEGLEPESLEYFHSFFADSIKNMIYLLKGNSLEELTKNEETQTVYNALMTGFQKIFVMLEEGEISEKDKRNLDKQIVKLGSEKEEKDGFPKS